MPFPSLPPPYTFSTTTTISSSNSSSSPFTTTFSSSSSFALSSYPALLINTLFILFFYSLYLSLLSIIISSPTSSSFHSHPLPFSLISSSHCIRISLLIVFNLPSYFPSPSSLCIYTDFHLFFQSLKLLLNPSFPLCPLLSKTRFLDFL